VEEGRGNIIKDAVTYFGRLPFEGSSVYGSGIRRALRTVRVEGPMRVRAYY